MCKKNNQPINEEVMLCSVQFLGFAVSVANALATSTAFLGNEEKVFIRDTFQIATEHLLRWGDDADINFYKKLAKKTPQDVKNASAALFFTDKPLWMITIYAELAGILQSQEQQHRGFITLSETNNLRFRQHLSALLQFFSARISIYHSPSSRLGNVDLADLDRGYHRLYGAKRYAGYEKEEKPVTCEFSAKDKTKINMVVNVASDTVQIRQDTGWDISHARRLVHALDALERNRNAIKNIFSLTDKELPQSGLSEAFANTLVAIVWNGDKEKPVFSNYWSGANGWYRVNYHRGAGGCDEGIPPYGLTISFTNGGYITWAKYRPIIGLLGQKLHSMINNSDVDSTSFIDKYYSDLSRSASARDRIPAMLMFQPSLVGVMHK